MLELLSSNEPSSEFPWHRGRRSLEGSQTNINPDSHASPNRQEPGDGGQGGHQNGTVPRHFPFAVMAFLSISLTPSRTLPRSPSATISQICRLDTGPLGDTSLLRCAGLQGICQSKQKATATCLPFVALSLEHKQASPAFMVKWPSPALSLKKKKKKSLIDRARHFMTSLHLGSRLRLAPTPFTPQWLLRMFLPPSGLIHKLFLVGAAAPCPGAGSSLTAP